jgi:carboxyl-terminal processing protease
MTESAAVEFQEAVDSLYRAGARALVLDLRGNRGGLVHTAVELADLFLPSGARIGELHGKQPTDREQFTARSPEAWPDLAVTVLTDHETASSAEIFAAALQDHDRAVVVGTTTYGKGVTQTTIPLSPDVALRLTTGRWYAPSGRPIQRGLTRDAAGRPTDHATYVSDGGRVLTPGNGVIPDVNTDRLEELDPRTRVQRDLLLQRAAAQSAHSTPALGRLRQDATVMLAAAVLTVEDAAWPRRGLSAHVPAGGR